MKKLIRWVLIILLVGIIIDLIYVCYFAINVSATLPPIKTYKYVGSTRQLINSLKSYSIYDPQFKLISVYTTGDRSSGFAYEIVMDITKDKSKLRYDLKCEDVNESVPPFVNLKLIGAHNLINDTGGYGLSAQGMNELLDFFDQDIITPLKNKYGIDIKPL